MPSRVCGGPEGKTNRRAYELDFKETSIEAALHDFTKNDKSIYGFFLQLIFKTEESTLDKAPKQCGCLCICIIVSAPETCSRDGSHASATMAMRFISNDLFF